MAITGHRTSKEVTRYTRGARQKVRAAMAMERLSKDRKAAVYPPEIGTE